MHIFSENFIKMNKRTLELNIEGNVFTIPYPNTGQQIDMELLKSKIADGQYDALRFSKNILFQVQADKIDMIATFSTLIPDLKKKLNTNSLFDISEEQSEILMTAYTNVFIPWYTEIKTAIQNPNAKAEEKPKDVIDNETAK